MHALAVDMNTSVRAVRAFGALSEALVRVSGIFVRMRFGVRSMRLSGTLTSFEHKTKSSFPI